MLTHRSTNLELALELALAPLGLLPAVRLLAVSSSCRLWLARDEEDVWHRVLVEEAEAQLAGPVGALRHADHGALRPTGSRRSLTHMHELPCVQQQRPSSTSERLWAVQYLAMASLRTCFTMVGLYWAPALTLTTVCSISFLVRASTSGASQSRHTTMPWKASSLLPAVTQCNVWVGVPRKT